MQRETAIDAQYSCDELEESAKHDNDAVDVCNIPRNSPNQKMRAQGKKKCSRQNIIRKWRQRENVIESSDAECIEP